MQVELNGVAKMHGLDGKLVESHVTWDVIGIAFQLGLTDRHYLLD